MGARRSERLANAEKRRQESLQAAQALAVGFDTSKQSHASATRRDNAQARRARRRSLQDTEQARARFKSGGTRKRARESTDEPGYDGDGAPKSDDRTACANLSCLQIVKRRRVAATTCVSFGVNSSSTRQSNGRTAVDRRKAARQRETRYLSREQVKRKQAGSLKPESSSYLATPSRAHVNRSSTLTPVSVPPFRGSNGLGNTLGNAIEVSERSSEQRPSNVVPEPASPLPPLRQAGSAKNSAPRSEQQAVVESSPANITANLPSDERLLLSHVSPPFSLRRSTSSSSRLSPQALSASPPRTMHLQSESPPFRGPPSSSPRKSATATSSIGRADRRRSSARYSPYVKTAGSRHSTLYASSEDKQSFHSAASRPSVGAEAGEGSGGDAQQHATSSPSRASARSACSSRSRRAGPLSSVQRSPSASPANGRQIADERTDGTDDGMQEDEPGHGALVLRSHNAVAPVRQRHSPESCPRLAWIDQTLPNMSERDAQILDIDGPFPGLLFSNGRNEFLLQIRYVRCALRGEDIPRAVDHVREACRKISDCIDADIRRLFAGAATLLQDYDSAGAALHQAAVLEPEQVKPLLMLAEVQAAAAERWISFASADDYEEPYTAAAYNLHAAITNVQEAGKIARQEDLPRINELFDSYLARYSVVREAAGHPCFVPLQAGTLPDAEMADF